MRPGIAVITVLVCALHWAASAQSSSTALTATGSFHCLWWAEAEMENLDPNSPPPKNTDVVIQKWEYSDPVGVPHPDVVDLVLEIRNTSDAPSLPLIAEVSGQWRTGPISSERKAAWGTREPIKSLKLDAIPPGKAASVRVPIDIAGRMSELRAKKAWPWRFRALLTVRDAGSNKTLLSREFSLPIQPGD